MTDSYQCRLARCDEAGATILEYAMLAAIFLVMAIFTATLMGDGANAIFIKASGGICKGNGGTDSECNASIEVFVQNPESSGTVMGSPPQ